MSRRQGHSWGWTLPLRLNSAGLEKVDVQAYTSSGLLRVGLYIAWNVKFNHSTYQYIPVHTGMYQYDIFHTISYHATVYGSM